MKKSLIAIAVGLCLGAIAGVGSATLGKQEAVAMPCCSSCDGAWQYCYNNCNGDPACEGNCDIRWDYCWGHCSESC